MNSLYKTVVLKFSGEALQDDVASLIISKEKLGGIIKVISEIYLSGVNVGVVVGAGNIFRGRIAQENGLSSESGDYMGMTGTIINMIAISDLLTKNNIPNKLLSALALDDVATKYSKEAANVAINEHKVCLFAAGVGKPNFTTDTCAASRAIDINADAILMGKFGVKGIYDSDPRKNKDAKFLENLTYDEVLSRDLKVMDRTAIQLLQKHNIITKVFSMDDLSNFIRVIQGENIGSTIKEK
jgi:uridylate kinase